MFTSTTYGALLSPGRSQKGGTGITVKAITGHRTDKVFARYNKPSLETLRAVVEGAPRTSVVKRLSNSPGRETATVLSA